MDDEFDNVPDGALVAVIAAEHSRGGQDAVTAFLIMKKHPIAGLRLIALLAPETLRQAAEERSYTQASHLRELFGCVSARLAGN